MVLAPARGSASSRSPTPAGSTPRRAGAGRERVAPGLLDVPDDAVRTDVAEHPEIWRDLCGWYSFGPGVLTDPQPRTMLGAGVEVVVSRTSSRSVGRRCPRCARPSPPPLTTTTTLRLPYRPLRVRVGHILVVVQPRTRRRVTSTSVSYRCPSETADVRNPRLWVPARSPPAPRARRSRSRVVTPCVGGRQESQHCPGEPRPVDLAGVANGSSGARGGLSFVSCSRTPLS